MSEETVTATATEGLTLTPPDPVPVVAPEKAAGLVPLSTDQKSKLEERVDSFIDDLVAQDENSPEFGKRVDQITNMGRKEMLEAASHSNRFLDRPIRAMDRDTDIGQSLIELRTTVERLDPSANGKLLSKRGFLDKVFGSKINNYFAQYRSAQTHIGGILTALANGKDELLMDNAAIDVERRKMWESMGKLEQMIHISNTLDARLEAKATELDGTDPAKAKTPSSPISRWRQMPVRSRPDQCRVRTASRSTTNFSALPRTSATRPFTREQKRSIENNSRSCCRGGL